MTKAPICLVTALLLTSACGGASPEPAEPDPAPKPSDPAPAEPLGGTDDPAVGDEEVAVDEEAPAASAAPTPEAPPVASKEEQKPPGAAVSETRTTEVIQGVVNQNRDSVRRCFDALSKEEKGNGGTLTIAFTLGPRGNVRSAGLNEERSTLKYPALVSCATNAIKAMKFPASSRGFEASVNYPFSFKP